MSKRNNEKYIKFGYIRYAKVNVNYSLSPFKPLCKVFSGFQIGLCSKHSTNNESQNVKNF